MAAAPHNSAEEIRAALAAILRDGQTTEIRAKGARTPDGRFSKTSSGYFLDDPDAIVRDVERLQAEAIWIALNPVDSALLARANNRLKPYASVTTNDRDIRSRRWLLVDCDPVRPSGISASDQEHDRAQARAQAISESLRSEGWPDPLIADSGNGAHLLYPLDLPNDEATTELVRDVLSSLALRFSDEVVDVDTSTYNAARMVKLYGTVARKGDPTPDRPHRLSRILSQPETLVPVTRDQLDRIARPARSIAACAPASKGPRGAFEVAAWIAEHLAEANGPHAWNGGKRWTLAQCPFNAEHTDRSAYLVELSNGAIAAGCHHASCEWGWPDLRARIEPAHARVSVGEGPPLEWPDRRPLPPRRSAVPTLDERLIPNPMRAWIVDEAQRRSIPNEMIAIPAIVAFSSVIGRAVTVRPGKHDNWTVVGNLWGAIVGEPGTLKSPALSAGTAPLEPLIDAARREYAERGPAAEARRMAIEQEIKRVLKPKGGAATDENRLARLLEDQEAARLVERRYKANDSTPEKILVLLRDNARGLLLERDELTGWIRSMDRAGREGERQLYLEAWSGDHTFTQDRIGRGTVSAPACLSIVGTLQPGPLAKLVREAGSGGEGADGFLQRFQMLAWPDNLGAWREPCGASDTLARERAFEVFRRMAEADAASVDAVDSGNGAFPYLCFDEEAAREWSDYRTHAIEGRVRDTGSKLPPIFRSHISKYRSLVPSLALQFHLLDRLEGRGRRDIGVDALRRAIAWAEFLEAHARKVYASAIDEAADAAHRIVEKIREGDIASGMTVRKIKRREWSGLPPKAVDAGLSLLARRCWLRVVSKPTGGRRSPIVELHPRAAEPMPTPTDETDKSSCAPVPDPVLSVLSVGGEPDPTTSAARPNPRPRRRTNWTELGEATR